MKCNIRRKNTVTTRCGLESNIHQQMSYRDIIDNVICFGPNDIPQIPDNVKMITATPARVMGLKNKGSLKVGYDSDIVIFDDDISIKKVIVATHSEI